MFHPRERRALEVALHVVDILQAEELRSRRAPHFAATRGQEGNEKNDDGGRQKACVSPAGQEPVVRGRSGASQASLEWVGSDALKGSPPLASGPSERTRGSVGRVFGYSLRPDRALGNPPFLAPFTHRASPRAGCAADTAAPRAKIPAKRHLSVSCGMSAGTHRDRRSSAPNVATEDALLQGIYSGSDGTRTRDLRRDRPVRARPTQPAPARNYSLEQAFHTAPNRL